MRTLYSFRMQNTEVLVSGAGVAGPAVAYWLREAGFAVTVVERAPAPRTGGQAVDLRGAGRTVIDRMGLLERARRIGLDQRGIAWVDADGRATARMPVQAFGGEGVISEIEILRGDLGRLLYEATRDGVEYLFDDAVTGLAQDATGVDVTFERAAPRRFALVVGADGLHSAVRGLAFGPESACLRPLGCYTAWFSAPADPDLDGWYLMHNAPGGRVASVRPGRLPGTAKAGLSFRADPVHYDHRDLDAQRRLLGARFAGVGWKVPALLAAAGTAPDFTFDAMAQVRLDRWSTGRVVLLGDAGYCPTPLTGLGTSLALVGAYVLAGELAAAGGEHRRAFDRYERLLRPYVRAGQQLPPGGVRGYAPATRLGIAAQAATMRAMTRWPVRPLLARQFAKAGAIALPDYGSRSCPAPV